jgi:hypothetical protein
MDGASCEENRIRRCRFPVNKILPQAQFAIAAAGKFASGYFKARCRKYPAMPGRDSEPARSAENALAANQPILV